MAYDIAEFKSGSKTFDKIETHSEKHEILRDLGFVLDKHEKKSKDIKDIFSFIKDIEKIRDKYPYGTDGVVVCASEIGKSCIVFKNITRQ
jgi:NAD-dependent DNA ligase